MKQALILGSGGVGTVTALALQSTGKVEVTMIVRSDYDIVKEKGYDFASCDYGTIEGWKPTRVVKTVDEAAKYKPYDYVFVSTKFIPELQRTEDLIGPVVSPKTCVVLLQNGLGNEEPVMAAFPDAYVFGGISMIGAANYHAKIKHTGTDLVAFGTYDKRPEAIEKCKELVDIYNLSKSKAEFAENLGAKRWTKLFYNAVYNTMAALTGVDTGRMYYAGMTESILRPAMKEVRLIAETDMQAKLPDHLEDYMLNCDASEYYEPSMMVDVKKGQVMELEAILGNPLRIAKKHKLSTPILKTVYALLRGKQFLLLEKRGTVSVPAPGFEVKDEKPVFENDLPWDS